jgi:peptidyl-prolyl cis-trans isomerase C
MFTHTKHTGFAAMAAVALVLMAQPAFAAANAGDDTVVATVNGDKILKKDVLGVIKSLPSKEPMKEEDTAKVFPIVVDQMINEKLLNSEKAKANIEGSPEFQQRMTMLHDQLLTNMYLEKYMKDRVNDRTIKAEYEKLKKDNKGKEEIHARQILLKTEEEAKEAIKALDSGANFQDLAKQRSMGPTAASGGDVGYFTKGELIPEFSDAAFKLKTGTYTKEPVKSQFGYHVILVEDRRPRNVPDLKDLEGTIRQKLQQDEMQKLVQGLRAKADIKRFDMNGKPVEEPKKN